MHKNDCVAFCCSALWWWWTLWSLFLQSIPTQSTLPCWQKKSLKNLLSFNLVFFSRIIFGTFGFWREPSLCKRRKVVYTHNILYTCFKSYPYWFWILMMQTATARLTFTYSLCLFRKIELKFKIYIRSFIKIILYD